ncbi:hypothetical protein Hanom_Chr07g00613341 [Helianthus anomalus]
MSSVPSGTKLVPVPKNRNRKSPKVGTGTGIEYTRFGTVRYRYLRVKTGKYRYEPIPDRTGTENINSWYQIGTEKVPGPVNSVPVGLICSSLLSCHNLFHVISTLLIC